MTAAETMQGAELVGVGPPPERPKPGFSSSDRVNFFEAIPRVAYEESVWRQPSPFMRSFLINDPAAIRRVLIDEVENYPKMEMERRAFRALFGEGLLSADGDTWRRHRRVMAPSFDPRSVASYAPDMAAASVEFADRWAALGAGAEVDVSDEMTLLTLRIICRTMFSADGADITELTGSTLQRGSDEAFKFNLLDIVPGIAQLRMRRRERLMASLFAPLDGSIHRLIAARRADPGKTDLLGRLVAALDAETGNGLSAEEVRNEVLTIFVAGHETTASAMTFVWYVLSQQPHWEARLHEELAQVLGGRAPTEADLPRLSLTRRIVEETMRLYPPAPGLSARVALKGDELAGVRIPAKSLVGVSSWVLHRHRRLWDSPDRFDPDRFLPERSEGRPRFAYLPFGGGPRVCIGQQLAMTEAILILATLAQRFRPRLRPGFRVAIQQRVTIRPRDGLPMTLGPR